jgi:hypothetical protein
MQPSSTIPSICNAISSLNRRSGRSAPRQRRSGNLQSRLDDIWPKSSSWYVHLTFAVTKPAVVLNDPTARATPFFGRFNMLGPLPIARSTPKPCGASSHETYRWREPDSNPQSHPDFNRVTIMVGLNFGSPPSFWPPSPQPARNAGQARLGN